MRWLVGDRNGRTVRRFLTERDAIAFALALKENGQYAYVAYEDDVSTVTYAEPVDDASQWWSKDRMAEWRRFIRWIEREEERGGQE
jgi:hypothetical protein